MIAAAALLAVHLVRLAGTPGIVRWYTPVLLILAWLLADFASGIVHWSADTWGKESMPVLGPRFLRPFRVHHVNPDDFLQRTFVDTNGDVALVVLPVLIGALFIPLASEGARAATTFVVALAAFALPTNQVHQWAHMPRPPAPIRFLQGIGIILSREQHVLHHEAPYAMNYCITNGWCNRLLTAVDFFPRAERLITSLTGAEPRADER